MTEVFIPQTKGRIKTTIRGFWYSQETKRTYYDYFKVRRISYDNLKIKVNYYKYLYSQESLFYKILNCGYIFYDMKKTIKLTKRIYKRVAKRNLKKEIKEALKLYGGITIYKKGKKYFKEIFYNED